MRTKARRHFPERPLWRSEVADEDFQWHLKRALFLSDHLRQIDFDAQRLATDALDPFALAEKLLQDIGLS